MSSPDDRPQPDAAPTRSPRARKGVAALMDGPSQNVRLSLLRGEIVLIDRLAMDIRLHHRAWITRSGIVTALIEAAMRAEGEA